MSTNKMLIDASHPEETRVVLLREGRVEEFDYESAARKLLRGNIYLAKVTRVEPSLQAAFVEYGGNRHGFLAFNEIHPDYYQIPMADRQALLEEEAAADAAEEATADAEAEELALAGATHGESSFLEEGAEDASVDEPQSWDAADSNGSSAAYGTGDTLNADSELGANTPLLEGASDADLENARSPDAEYAALTAHHTGAIAESVSDTELHVSADDPGAGNGEPANGQDIEEVAAPAADPETIEPVDDVLEEVRPRPRRRLRNYKIQEVIKRRQVILVQVVKEERGNKGAALTTYLSLAGRYTVLMPNTARGGGISRKITNPQDRKRLKAIATELDVPEGMGLIVRTAGASRTKQELKRDFEYLLRLWESVRDFTLKSTAPSLVYEEGNLIKRSIRDLYNKDIDEVIVAGSDAHKEAKDFMRMLMPSHARHVALHQEPESLFTSFGIERQLNAMFSPHVTLKSGGYLVINQTEALVAIDVNSGKATREFSIEETALATNLEAADEIARQLKLRDLAGLIIIDFIDMEEKRNNRAVERRLKEALRHDRARIQLGRISHFGLMEMSRQRLRTGVLEGSTSQCPHCQGTGIIRSTESVALAVLRAIEETVLSEAPAAVTAATSVDVAIYILNNKRPFINEIEQRHGVSVAVQASEKMHGANFVVSSGAVPESVAGRTDRGVVSMDWGLERSRSSDQDSQRQAGGAAHQDELKSNEGTGSTKRRRRRGGLRKSRPNGGQNGDGQEMTEREGSRTGDLVADASAGDTGDGSSSARGEQADDGRKSRRRRRGRRGGRRERERVPHDQGVRPSSNGDYSEADKDQSQTLDGTATTADGDRPLTAALIETQPAEAGVSDGVISDAAVSSARDPGQSSEALQNNVSGRKPRPKYAATSSAPKLEHVLVTPDNSGPANESEDLRDEGADKTSRRGWWQRRFSGGD